jgi:hypothetical protein
MPTRGRRSGDRGNRRKHDLSLTGWAGIGESLQNGHLIRGKAFRAQFGFTGIRHPIGREPAH